MTRDAWDWYLVRDEYGIPERMVGGFRKPRPVPAVEACAHRLVPSQCPACRGLSARELARSVGRA